jgi:hypothetical protein
VKLKEMPTGIYMVEMSPFAPVVGVPINVT